MSEAILQYPFRPRASAVPLRLIGDSRLTRLASQGDERAYTAIYDRHAQGLYRYCLSLLHNSEDASDAVQGTMMKALLALPAKRPEVPLKPWLFRIAHNEAISVQRRRRTHAELDDQDAGFGRGADEEWAEQGELKQLVEDLLALPERQRSALVMRELNGLEYEEIRISLGTSAAAAKQTVYEARAALFERAKGRELACAGVRQALSEGDRRALRGRRIDAHLRSCAGCTEFQRHTAQRTEALGALAPGLPGLGALGLLKILLGGAGGGGGGAGGGGGGLLAGVSGGASAMGSAAALKPAAALAVLLLATSAAPIPHKGGDAEGAPPPLGSTAFSSTATDQARDDSFFLWSARARDPFAPALPVGPEAPLALEVGPLPDPLPLVPSPPVPPLMPPDGEPSAEEPPLDSQPPASHRPSHPLPKPDGFSPEPLPLSAEPSNPALESPASPLPATSAPQPVQQELSPDDYNGNGRHIARGHTKHETRPKDRGKDDPFAPPPPPDQAGAVFEGEAKAKKSVPSPSATASPVTKKASGGAPDVVGDPSGDIPSSKPHPVRIKSVKSADDATAEEPLK